MSLGMATFILDVDVVAPMMTTEDLFYEHLAHAKRLGLAIRARYNRIQVTVGPDATLERFNHQMALAEQEAAEKHDFKYGDVFVMVL